MLYKTCQHSHIHTLLAYTHKPFGVQYKRIHYIGLEKWRIESLNFSLVNNSLYLLSCSCLLWLIYCDSHEPLSVSLQIFLFLFQDINKRLSLPADIRLPEGYLEKFAMNSPPFDKPMSRRLRRASLVSAVCVCLCVYFHLYILYECKATKTSFVMLLWFETKEIWTLHCHCV